MTTSLKPYDGIADLYLIDPDGYIIRKWNSMEMNVGVLLQDFDLPDWPKVMTIAPPSLMQSKRIMMFNTRYKTSSR